jgi:hypothetical protein
LRLDIQGYCQPFRKVRQVGLLALERRFPFLQQEQITTCGYPQAMKETDREMSVPAQIKKVTTMLCQAACLPAARTCLFVNRWQKLHVLKMADPGLSGI